MEPTPARTTALVTGASRGIGRAVAVELAAAGIDVLALARDRRALEALAEQARRGGAITPLPCDLTDRGALQACLSSCGDATIVVNAAGWATPRTSVARARLDDWQRTLDVCLWAPMTIVRALLPNLVANGSGAIVQILSPAARRGRAGESAYAAAKAGLRGFTESLRDELRDTDVRVISIYPGFVDTQFLPPNRRLDRGRLLQPEDVAAAVLLSLRGDRRICPVEIVLEPQRDPLGTSRRGAKG